MRYGTWQLPGAVGANAEAINDTSASAGWVRTPQGPRHAVLWEKDALGNYALTDLGLLPGYIESGVHRINAAERMVGDLTLPNGDARAFVYDAVNGMRELTPLIPGGSGWLLWGGNRINDQGQIVGFGYLNGAPRGFLLTPVTAADTSPPTTNASINGPLGSNAWYTGPVQVTLSPPTRTATATWPPPITPSTAAHSRLTRVRSPSPPMGRTR